MSDDLRGIDDVQFNWAAAKELAKELRSTATVLDKQIGERGRIAAGARKQWEGSYAHQFDGRLNIGTSDAHNFVSSMRKAAKDLDDLADLAQKEQHRREQARKWLEQQHSKNILEKGLDAAKSLIGLGEDVPTPPPPIDPPPPNIPMHEPKSRGSSVPAGRT